MLHWRIGRDEAALWVFTDAAVFPDRLCNNIDLPFCFPLCTVSSLLPFFSSLPAGCELSDFPLIISVHTMNASVVLGSNGSVTEPWFVTSHHSSSSVTLRRSLCCVIALALWSQWQGSLAALWCNLRNTRASVAFSVDGERAGGVSVLTFPIYSHSQRGVC